jgi:hypothetical protein
MSQEKVSTTKTITDPSLEPYFISMDDYCYTLKQKITPTYSDSGKEYIHDVGHFTNVDGAIKKIIKLKVNTQSYESLKQYLEEYKNIQQSINKQFGNL